MTPSGRRRFRFHPDSSETFLPNLIHSVYTTPLSALMPHRLALLLMILAIGSVVDPRVLDKQVAEKYHHLARAALCEVPIMDDTSIDAVNALVSCFPFGVRHSRTHCVNPPTVLYGMVSPDLF